MQALPVSPSIQPSASLKGLGLVLGSEEVLERILRLESLQI